MSMVKQLITTTTQGTLLISEIQELVKLGKQDDHPMVQNLFGDLWIAMEALLNQEITIDDCLVVTNEIMTALEQITMESEGLFHERIRLLMDKLQHYVIDEFLQKCA